MTTTKTSYNFVCDSTLSAWLWSISIAIGRWMERHWSRRSLCFYNGLFFHLQTRTIDERNIKELLHRKERHGERRKMRMKERRKEGESSNKNRPTLTLVFRWTILLPVWQLCAISQALICWIVIGHIELEHYGNGFEAFCCSWCLMLMFCSHLSVNVWCVHLRPISVTTYIWHTNTVYTVWLRLMYFT